MTITFNTLKALVVVTFLLWAGFSFGQDKLIWVDCDPPLEIDSLFSTKVIDFKNTPESILIFFYASQILKDTRWEEVIPEKADRNPTLVEKLQAYNNWNFKKIKLVSKCEYAPGKLWIRILMEVEFDGKIKTGEDEVSLSKINGRWVIVSVPT